MATTTTATKSTSTLQASASNGAGSTTNSSSIDMTTKMECDLRGLITNGGTGPTVALTVTVQVSSDNATWKDTPMAVAPAGTGNSATGTFFFKGLRGGQYYRLKFSGNTGQAVTVEGFVDHITNYSTA